jgi:hypothetical protein
MRASKVVAVLAALAPLSLPALAQEPPAAPPVMRITIEDIKPGSMGLHEKSVASYLAFFSRAQVPMTRMGMVPIAGDQNQVLYLEGFPSFEALEAADRKLETTIGASPALQAELEALDKSGGPLHSSQRSMIAVFRPDLSYRPLGAAAVGRSRYVRIGTLRIKLGRVPDYESYVKQGSRAREKANLTESNVVYQVTNGGPGATFLNFVAFRSLAEMDADRAGAAARNKAFDEALGGEEVTRQRRETFEAVVADFSAALYALNPRLGTPPPQIASADPDFWTPKVTGKALAVKTDGPKK